MPYGEDALSLGEKATEVAAVDRPSASRDAAVTTQALTFVLRTRCHEVIPHSH